MTTIFYFSILCKIAELRQFILQFPLFKNCLLHFIFFLLGHGGREWRIPGSVYTGWNRRQRNYPNGIERIGLGLFKYIFLYQIDAVFYSVQIIWFCITHFVRDNTAYFEA